MWCPYDWENQYRHWIFIFGPVSFIEAETKWPPFSRRHFQMHFSMKMYDIRIRLHRSLFLRFELTIFEHCFRLWLGIGQATSHCLTQWWLVYWCIYASPGLNELTIALYPCSFLSSRKMMLKLSSHKKPEFHRSTFRWKFIYIQQNLNFKVKTYVHLIRPEFSWSLVQRSYLHILNHDGRSLSQYNSIHCI